MNAATALAVEPVRVRLAVPQLRPVPEPSIVFLPAVVRQVVPPLHFVPSLAPDVALAPVPVCQVVPPLRVDPLPLIEPMVPPRPALVPQTPPAPPLAAARAAFREETAGYVKELASLRATVLRHARTIAAKRDTLPPIGSLAADAQARVLPLARRFRPPPGLPGQAKRWAGLNPVTGSALAGFGAFILLGGITDYTKAMQLVAEIAGIAWGVAWDWHGGRARTLSTQLLLMLGGAVLFATGSLFFPMASSAGAAGPILALFLLTGHLTTQFVHPADQLWEAVTTVNPPAFLYLIGCWLVAMLAIIKGWGNLGRWFARKFVQREATAQAAGAGINLWERVTSHRMQHEGVSVGGVQRVRVVSIAERVKLVYWTFRLVSFISVAILLYYNRDHVLAYLSQKAVETAAPMARGTAAGLWSQFTQFLGLGH